MTSIKSSRTWADIQESLSRVRQQYGLLPRAEWDDLIAMTSYEKAMSAKHKNKSLPRSFLPSLVTKSSRDLRNVNLEYADTKRHKQHEGRRAKYDPFFHKPILVKNTEHDKMKPSLEYNAYRYFTENKHFSWDFVDSFVSEILTDEIVPDVLIEALTNNIQMPKKKHYGKKTTQWKSDNYRRSSGSHSMSLLDELLIEILRDLSAHVLRRMVRDFVDDHLARSALHDCIDEILTSIIQTELSSMVDDLNTETEQDRYLDNLIQSVIDKEVKDTVISVLTECDDQLSELHKNQITVTANKHVVDLFLLEHLLDMIGAHESLMFGKDPMQCLLDSVMLDVLLREQVNIKQVQRNTFENYPAMHFHQNTVSKVALESILTELQMMLVEDMEDIFEYERDVEFG
ncbi:uncharacterized protein LOC122926925 [Bufo gargarizans]|uniref:uncharacterized protein LOC122926925 n=1 Tax=Bufo gargarizans TaxID=30331 RepID=UPI001CF26E62|nr:uncharacterized protein LOC122926925 [Bufo gargarizans]XP_044134379.1 uncharacterized protein LOC122926925 [Bufo gargarizans]XP_044134380.1 uncharacterized protein LOC122926925 [Bufo gargarizans]XP_044134381.1 uncharacterized protein LOC122926925 [Bufo gargarizans]